MTIKRTILNEHEKELKVRKLFPMVRKYFGNNVDLVQATEILNKHTNILDSDGMIEQQLQIAVKELKKVGK